MAKHGPAAAARELGHLVDCFGAGNVVVPAADMPYGRMAGLQDPWGAVFCILKPQPMQ